MGFVQSTSNFTSGGASLILTLNGVSSNNTLVLMIANDPNNPITSGLSGWSVGNAPGANVVNALIYFLPSPTNGNYTVTLSGPDGLYAGASLSEWSGFTASPLDVAPAASNTTVNGTAGSASISSGLLSQPSEVIFAVVMEGTSGSGSTNIGLTDPPSGFTSLYSNQNSETNNGWEMCYKIVSANVSVTAAWTWTDTANIYSQTTLASFKFLPRPTRLYANGQFFSNTFIEGGTQLGGGTRMKIYANGNTQILSIAEVSGSRLRTYANGTMAANTFSEQ